MIVTCQKCGMRFEFSECESKCPHAPLKKRIYSEPNSTKDVQINPDLKKRLDEWKMDPLQPRADDEAGAGGRKRDFLAIGDGAAGLRRPIT